jgi:hypothetical protein
VEEQVMDDERLECLQPPADVSRAEWLWVLAWSGMILLLVSLPYLYGTLLSTPGSQFGGFILGVEDGNSYLAKMRLGATGAWQFHLFYTSEPHAGAYVFLFHLLLGKMAHFAGLSLILAYHLARLICGLFLLVTVYRFVAFFTALRRVRRLAFWLVALGSGLGWLILLLGLLDQLGLPLDFYSPEAFAFHALFSLPHLALAEALLLWAILFLWVGWERQQVRYAVLAGLALLGMTVIAAFYIATAAAVIGAGWLLRGWRQKQAADRRWAEGGLAALALAIATPVPLYNVYVFMTNPVFKAWAEQNLVLSPSPVHYLLAFGLLAVFAALGARAEWRRDSDRSLLLIGWCAVVPLLVYIPFNLQRRFSLGVQVPLSILAALGLWQLLDNRRTVLRRWRIVSVGVVGLLSLSNFFILTSAGWEVSQQSPPIFHLGAEVDAADWLGAHLAPDQVVLAAYQTGNYLPTRMPARVFIGLSTETANLETKDSLLHRFFGAGDDAFRRQLLEDYNVTYVFYGPFERALGSFSPAAVSYLRLVYDNGPVQIYQVLPGDAP